jgi:hypothetical protein
MNYQGPNDDDDRIRIQYYGEHARVTINPTSDPNYPGAEYVCITTEDGTKLDATMIVDSDGNILNENPSSPWWEES